MPKQLFFSLSEDKKNRILLAAKKELAENDFENVSINRIINAAEIARGSFYLYFEDKYDLYIFLLEETSGKIIENVIEIYKPKSIEEGFISLFDYFIDKADNSEKYLAERMLRNINYKEQCIFNEKLKEFDMQHKEEKEERIRVLYNLLSSNELEYEEIVSNLDLFMGITFMSITKVKFMKENAKEIREKMIERLNIIRKGIIGIRK